MQYTIGTYSTAGLIPTVHIHTTHSYLQYCKHTNNTHIYKLLTHTYSTVNMQTPHTFTNSHTCTCTHMATLSHAHIHTPISHSQPHWYPTHPPTHTHTPPTHTLKEERQRVCERARLGTTTPPCTLDEAPTLSMEYGPLLPSVWNINHSYPQYGIWTTTTLSMEYEPLLPSVWNMNHSYPHYGIWTTPTFSMEYGPLLPSVWNMNHSYPPYGIWTTPNLSMKYPLLTSAWNMDHSQPQ